VTLSLKTSIPYRHKESSDAEDKSATEPCGLLKLLSGVTRYGAVGQGHFANDRSCRSGWASAAGATSATFILDNVFDVRPPLSAFAPEPRLDTFDKHARLEDLVIRGIRYRVTRGGCESVPTPR
jgi:hypothetical protein